jgi:transcriptional regulator with XRE-family HTH domain
MIGMTTFSITGKVFLLLDREFDLFKTVLPRRIVAGREIHHLTQRALAARARMSPTRLGELEAGLAADAKVSTIARISEVLHIPVYVLLGGAERSGPEPWKVGQGILDLHDGGATIPRIASMTALSEEAVRFVLAEQMEICRRRRVFP